jgi:transaldolase
MKEYAGVVDKAIQYAKAHASTLEEQVRKALQPAGVLPTRVQISPPPRHTAHPLGQVELASEALFVGFGVEILKLVPGRVSTEVDARYGRAKRLLARTRALTHVPLGLAASPLTRRPRLPRR